MELHKKTLTELTELLQSKVISANECISYFAKRIEAINPSLNAFVALDIDGAITQAKAIDDRRTKGAYLGRLAGIPFGVKDLEDAAGFVTTSGSALFCEAEKSQRNSHMVETFVKEGAIPIGKTNTPEFGWKSDTDNFIFGPTRNPWDTNRSPGGSSGGSAASVACGMIPFATGSDGGGSLRIPASACGISAMKTSLGRVPSTNPSPGGWSDLSVPGPLARNIWDTALLLDLVVTHDGRDLRSQMRKGEYWHQELSVQKKPKKIAFSMNLGYSPIDKEVANTIERALKQLESAGIEIQEIDTLFASDPLEQFYTITYAYYAKMLKPLMDHPNYALVDISVREQVEKGLKISATEFLEALDAAFYLNRTLYSLFQSFDLLISPTTASLPPFVGKNPQIDGVEGPDWVKLTYPFNMTRSPAASVCAGLSSSGIPVGLQIVGPHLGDLEVLRAAKYFEDILGTFAPKLFNE